MNAARIELWVLIPRRANLPQLFTILFAVVIFTRPARFSSENTCFAVDVGPIRVPLLPLGFTVFIRPPPAHLDQKPSSVSRFFADDQSLVMRTVITWLRSISWKVSRKIAHSLSLTFDLRARQGNDGKKFRKCYSVEKRIMICRNFRMQKSTFYKIVQEKYIARYRCQPWNFLERSSIRS